MSDLAEIQVGSQIAVAGLSWSEVDQSERKVVETELKGEGKDFIFGVSGGNYVVGSCDSAVLDEVAVEQPPVSAALLLASSNPTGNLCLAHSFESQDGRELCWFVVVAHGLVVPETDIVGTFDAVVEAFSEHRALAVEGEDEVLVGGLMERLAPGSEYDEDLERYFDSTLAKRAVIGASSGIEWREGPLANIASVAALALFGAFFYWYFFYEPSPDLDPAKRQAQQERSARLSIEATIADIESRWSVSSVEALMLGQGGRGLPAPNVGSWVSKALSCEAGKGCSADYENLNLSPTATLSDALSEFCEPSFGANLVEASCMWVPQSVSTFEMREATDGVRGIAEFREDILAVSRISGGGVGYRFGDTLPPDIPKGAAASDARRLPYQMNWMLEVDARFLQAVYSVLVNHQGAAVKGFEISWNDNQALVQMMGSVVGFEE